MTHLECSLTGERYEADTLHGLADSGKPLLVRYDLEALKGKLTREILASRPPTLWKWREMLPVRSAEDCVTLGEWATPSWTSRLSLSSTAWRAEARCW